MSNAKQQASTPYLSPILNKLPNFSKRIPNLAITVSEHYFKSMSTTSNHSQK